MEEQSSFRKPKKNEIVGIVVSTLGGARMLVECADGKERNCRIPGRLRRMWVREGDYVLVVPWEIEGDKRGDIVYRYKKLDVSKLRSKGYLKGLE